MDDVARAWWETQFQLRFLLAKGSEFQELFCALMELGHPGDFQRVRPWGSAGDRKNDGYLRSQRILFQVYGPNEMTAAAAIAKIAGEPRFAPPVFDHIGPLLHRSSGRIGGAGVQIHPDYRYANLYHWLLGDTHFYRSNMGIPMPLIGRPYASGPDVE